jgi:glycosyltransferase involved in cell wall biosynthesis
MRILIINSEFPPIGGGAGKASANLSRELVAMGQEVTVLTSSFADLPPDECLDGVQVVRIKALRRKQDRSSALEQIIFMVLSCFATLGLMRRWRPDITLAYFGVPSGPAALLARIFYGIPYVVSMRGGDVPGFRPYDFATYHKLVAPLLRIIWHRAEVLVANSTGLQDLAQKFDSRVPMEVIPNGVDIERYVANQRQWEPTRILLVGRLVYQKGIDLLVQALADLQSLNWTLSLVGDGPELDNIQSQATALGIADRIRYENWLTGDDLLQQYQAANLFVFPSRHEGMPNAVLEAMACGLPVVASRIAGNEELVVPGETGILVPAEDVPALKDALADLISNVARRQKMGAAARLHVEQNYAWNQIARQYLTLMQDRLAT